MKKGKINLHKEFEEENEQTNSYQITFDLSTEQIKAPIYSLVKYSQVVLDEVKNHDIFIKLSNKLKEYQKNKHISKDSIKHFFKILEDDRNDISITNDEFTDLCKLATIFKVKPLENY